MSRNSQERERPSRSLIWMISLVMLTAACSRMSQQDARAGQPEKVAEEPSGAPASRSPVEMAKVPAGLFVYGATESQFQVYIAQSRVGFPGMTDLLRKALVIPPQPIDLPDFWMDRFEVTNRQFSEFLVDTGYRPASQAHFLEHWNGSQYPDWAGDFPVVWVSGKDAEAYCRWRNERLPTDPEWEKAFRGPSGRLFPWGDRLPDPDTANSGTGKIEPVGNRPADCSQYGIYDLAGNVSELTDSGSDVDTRPGYIIRGGSFQSGIQNLLGFHRSPGVPVNERSATVGFRCASDHPPEDQPATSSAPNDR